MLEIDSYIYFWTCLSLLLICILNQGVLKLNIEIPITK